MTICLSNITPRFLTLSLGTMGELSTLTIGSYKELGPAKLPCYNNRVLLYPTSL